MIALVTTFLITWAATWGLARGAARLGLVERVFEGEAERKQARQRVPVVGGIAILMALLGAQLLFGGVAELAPARASWGGAIHFSEPWTWAALSCAFFVGLGDDRFGFRPHTKLLGQLFAGLCLVAPLVFSEGFSVEVCAWLLGALLAQNAINTFDNADGAATSLVAVALFAPVPVAAAAVAGFLPLNLASRTRGGPTRPLLGDAGSHLLGMLVLINPVAWPVLCLPLLDLARVACRRMQLGIAPWIGDRRHLAHRLELAGLSRLRVVGVLLGIAAPSLLAVNLAPNGSDWALALGFLSTASLFVLAVLRSPDPDRATNLQSQPLRTVVLRELPAQRSPQEPIAIVPEAVHERPRDVSSLVQSPR